MNTELIFTVSISIILIIISAVLTVIFKWVIQKWGGSLYTSVRGGTPRAVGIAPFITILLFLPFPYSNFVAIIGIFAFVDDLIGRKKIKTLPIELGQLSRGIGMIIIAIYGFHYFGPASILIALMIQPMNIADMQPGTAGSTVIIMSIFTVILMNVTSIGYLVPLVILAACIGYAPLDYKGKIMMGEIGNHSFAVGLGISYAILGGYLGIHSSIGYYTGSFLVTLTLLIITALLISFIRRKNLKIFMEKKLAINNPYYFDYVMDVLTGGGLGDLVRRLLIKKHEIIIKRQIFKYLGFRRLVYNPYAHK